MALDVLKAALSFGFVATASRYQTGAPRRTGTANYKKDFNHTIGTGALAGNEVYAAVRTLAGGASETIDLNGGLANVVGDASITIARIKGMLVWLLSATDTVGEGTGAVTGTAATSITIGNTGSNQFLWDMGAAAHTRIVVNGGIVMTVRPDATGWATAAGSTDNLLVTNNDGAVSAKYLLAFIGAAT